MISKFQISLFLLFTFSFFLFPLHAFASHCDSSGNFASLNSYCDPSTNTIWEDQADCTHSDTGNTCPVPIIPPAPPPSVITPLATGAPTASISASAPESPEEAAIKNMGNGLMPEEIPQEKDNRPGIIQALGNFFGAIGALKDRLLSFTLDSAGLKASEVPENQVGKINNPGDVINVFLGDDKNKGVYNNTSPEDQTQPSGKNVRIGPAEIPGTVPANQKEQFYEQSYFPEGCHQITGICKPF